MLVSIRLSIFCEYINQHKQNVLFQIKLYNQYTYGYC